MSPEQARGQEVDERTDIWAFGCLLYELLTGKRAFHCDSIQDTIAAVLESEPDLHALPAKTPAKIRELLRRCLQKDPGHRLQSIADARKTIEEVQRGSKRWQAIAAAAALVILRDWSCSLDAQLRSSAGPRPLRSAHQVPRRGEPARAFAGWADARVYSRKFHLRRTWSDLR